MMKKYFPVLCIIVGILIGILIVEQPMSSNAPLLDKEHDGLLHDDVPQKSSSSISSKSLSPLPSSSSQSASPSSSSAVDEPTRETTFRNGIWGDTLEIIKKYDNAKGFEVINADDGTFYYAGYATVNGYTNTKVIYHFDYNGTLFHGVYGFDVGGIKGGAAIREYEALKEDLIKLYGAPVRDEVMPLTTQSLIDYAGPEDSIEYGYTAYIAQWENDKSEIHIMLGSEKHKMILSLEYTDINHVEDLSKSGL